MAAQRISPAFIFYHQHTLTIHLLRLILSPIAPLPVFFFYHDTPQHHPMTPRCLAVDGFLSLTGCDRIHDVRRSC